MRRRDRCALRPFRSRTSHFPIGNCTCLWKKALLKWGRIWNGYICIWKVYNATFRKPWEIIIFCFWWQLRRRESYDRMRRKWEKIEVQWDLFISQRAGNGNAKSEELLLLLHQLPTATNTKRWSWRNIESHILCCIDEKYRKSSDHQNGKF